MKEATRPCPESADVGLSIATPRRRTPPSSGHLRPLSLAASRWPCHRPVGGGNVHRRTPATRKRRRETQAPELQFVTRRSTCGGYRTSSGGVRSRGHSLAFPARTYAIVRRDCRMPGRRRPPVAGTDSSYVGVVVALRPAARFDVVGAGVAPTSLLLRREYRPRASGWMLGGPSRSPERCRPYGTEQNATVAGTPGGNVETNAQSGVVAGSPLQVRSRCASGGTRSEGRYLGRFRSW